ncbi:I78 family peptidase inhibitor [Altererythrobacter litoralis]|uniref:I78 family peptidase inhibitor n=1 Tax=Altererythrobacter litoralis TaxID=3113904 RepID=A0ABU7GCM4_9SPHN|nr:I78 family peptidase inhibitor [Erythrobacteraceae bacterium 1XM1-14]
MTRSILPAIFVTLAACTTPGAGSSAGICNAEAAQGHVGHDASAAMGAAILRDSGAGTLRWGPPNSAWTMDYREDRVNVRYDQAMKITEITCG